MDILRYNQKLKERSQQLRRESTLCEILLWQELKQKKMNGVAFFRQKPIENYIVDFYAKELKLIIEIDGEIHKNKIDEDGFRQGELEALGCTVLRFTNDEIKINMKAVLEKIRKYCGRMGTNPNQNK